ncbi:MAG TPA: hypothetical protein V6C69_17195 [Trichormus sp.]
MTSFRADSLSTVALGAFLLFLLFYGFCITGLVLREPDICFLLGGGRWIIEHGHLPVTDPFSYTTHYHWASYVVEKWLTEVIFYAIQSTFGTLGLLIFDAVILSLAFVVMPHRIAHLCGWRGLPALGLTFLAALTSFSHLAIRPEIFSFAFAGIWLEILIRVNQKTEGNSAIDWRAIALISLLMCLWSNLHTLFLFGFLLPGLYTTCLFLERLFVKRLRQQPLNLTAPIMTFACLAASLVNPYGLGLWCYMPNVFGPFNDSNNEMQPIGLSSMLNPFFFPFYLFSLVSLTHLIRRLRQPLQHGDLFFRILIPAAIAGGFKTIRSIPLADLLLTAGVAHVLKKPQTQPSTFLDRLANPMSVRWVLLCFLVTVSGTVLATQAVPPEIPQASKAFTPPDKAIAYIEQHRPEGNLLNDPHFGATMIWKMRNNPPVFIDPRYNLFGNILLQDYWTMVDCAPGWQDRLKHYEINWVFLPPNLALSKRISGEPNWQLLYSDDCSVIYARKKHPDFSRNTGESPGSRYGQAQPQSDSHSYSKL